MYDLNPSGETQPGITVPLTVPLVDPATEFRTRLASLTPHIFVTYILVAINVAVYLAMIVKGVHPLEPTVDSLIRWGANFGPRSITNGEWWRLFTSMFLHIGVIHIAFNMFVLWQVGPFVERLLGNAGFLIVYLISGIAGAFVSLAWNPYVVSAGASGAIFGLYGALLGFMLMRRDSVPAEVLSPLVKNALIFIGYNAVYGFARSGTDVADHVGGLLGGFVCGLVVSVPLTLEALPRRNFRNVAVALGAVALFIGAAAKLPRPIDFQAALQSFASAEKKILAAYGAALGRVRTEHLSDDQLADVVEKDVLPNWITEHDKLTRLKGLPDQSQAIVSQLLRYMETRQQAWTLLVGGLRKHDINIVREANGKQHEADALAKQVGSSSH